MPNGYVTPLDHKSFQKWVNFGQLVHYRIHMIFIMKALPGNSNVLCIFLLPTEKKT